MKSAKVTQLCPTLIILQVIILEWVAFPFSRGFPNPGIEPRSLTLQTDSLPAEPQEIRDVDKKFRLHSLTYIENSDFILTLTGITAT